MSGHGAIFLDRDGTINIDKGYVHTIETFEFLDGAKEALKILQNAGFYLFLITNQSGIARGYFKEEDFYQLTDWMLGELQRDDIRIDDVFFCPHHIEGVISEYKIECECRKPKLGLYMAAQEKWNVNFSESYAVGDKIRDCAICCSTACKGFLLGNSERKCIVDRIKRNEIEKIRWSEDLLTCAQIIVKEII